MHIRLLRAAGALVPLLAAASAAGVSRAAPQAAVTGPPSKCITAPATFQGRSILPTLKTLGVTVWQVGLSWADVAPRRPKHPTDPRDRAYRWSAALDRDVAQAVRLGIEPVLYVNGFPAWSNGGKDYRWASSPADYAHFMAAVVRHFTTIRRFVAFSEPTQFANFEPQGGHGTTAPHVYARLLDAAYGAMHAARPNVVVIGGNMHPSGTNDARTTAPDTFLKNLVLPNGKRPRLDEFGDNPYTERPLDMSLPKRARTVDFDDMDWLASQLDRYWPGRHLPIFIGELGWNTEHGAWGWIYVVTRQDQAVRLQRAYQVATRLHRIDTICQFLLYDTPTTKTGDFYTNWTSGLATADGQRKPAWDVFAHLPDGPRRVAAR